MFADTLAAAELFGSGEKIDKASYLFPLIVGLIAAAVALLVG